MHGKFFGNILFDTVRILPEHGIQIFLKIPHEQFAAFTGQDPQDIALIVFQMIQQVGDLFPQAMVRRGKIMGDLFSRFVSVPFSATFLVTF